MKVETCSNCERVIGKLEQAYVFHGNVVCQNCYQILANNENKQIQAYAEGLTEVKTEAVPRQTETQEQKISCPKCGSTQIMAGKKGVDVGKVFQRAVLWGDLGLLFGFGSSNKIMITCLNCGHQWECGKK
jgi:tellurium resistance protein TerD